MARRRQKEEPRQVVGRPRSLYRASLGLSAILALSLTIGYLLQVRPAGNLPAATPSPARSAAAETPQLDPEGQTTLSLTPTTRSAPVTNIIEYTPERPSGEARTGSCWTNSLGVPSRAAWRCNVGNQTLDPCFALESGEVVCNPNPLTGLPGTLVKLSEPLPKPDLIAEKPSSAWLVELEDGTACNLATGATGLVDGKRINYLCSTSGAQDSKRLVILGDLRAGSVWQAEKAVVSLQDGKLISTSSEIVPLKTVVRGPSAFVPYACDSLAEAMGELVGSDVQRGEATFLDQITGDRGIGCQASVATKEVNPTHLPGDVVQEMLTVQGWQEDTRYRASVSGQSNSAYRSGGALCLMSAGWGPVHPAVSMGTAQQADSQRYLVTLNCAQDRLTGAAEVERHEPERINFETGATAGARQGRLAAAEIEEYALYAFGGQTMIAEVTAANQDVFLTVTARSDGLPLARASDNAKQWQGGLPGTEDYLIKVINRGEDTEFALRIVIPAILKLPSDGRPVSEKVTLDPGKSVQYVLKGEAGQSATITLLSAPGAYLAVSGLQDGQPLLPATSHLAKWDGQFPISQNYLVEVASDYAGGEYDLEISAP